MSDIKADLAEIKTHISNLETLLKHLITERNVFLLNLGDYDKLFGDTKGKKPRLIDELNNLIPETPRAQSGHPSVGLEVKTKKVTTPPEMSPPESPLVKEPKTPIQPPPVKFYDGPWSTQEEEENFISRHH